MGKLMNGPKYRNFEDHHKQRMFVVFYYYTKDRADFFESLLIENEIPYERGEGKDLLRRHLLGIHKKYQERAEKLNDEVGDFYRKPFLGDIKFRNLVLIFTLVVVLLALMGYFVAKYGNQLG
jgi:hypothetical protein